MNLQTSALLLVVLAAFGALWWFTAAGSGFGTSGESRTGEPLFDAAPLGLRVERDAGDFVLRREGGFWSQISPVWFPLSEEAGRDVARALAGSVVQEEFEPGRGGPRLSELALDPPAATLEVVGSAGVSRVGLGESTPGGRSFAIVEEAAGADREGNVVVIPEGLHRFVHARHDGSWFETKAPLPPLDAVVSMSLRGEEDRTPIQLVRERGRWRLDDDGAPVRAGVIDRMRKLIEDLHVRQFVVGPEASAGPNVFGLGSPSAVWDLAEADGRVTRLAVGRSGGLGEDSVYGRIEREESETLLQSPILRLPPTVRFLTLGRSSLADPRPFPVEAAGVQSLRLAAEGGGAVEFQAGPEGELVRANGAAPADAPDPADVLRALLSLEGERRIRPPERVYGGDAVPEPRVPAELEKPAGLVGRITLGHGLIEEIDTQLIRRRGSWVFRPLHERERVEYVLDEASEDVLEADVLPLLRSLER